MRKSKPKFSKGWPKTDHLPENHYSYQLLFCTKPPMKLDCLLVRYLLGSKVISTEAHPLPEGSGSAFATKLVTTIQKASQAKCDQLNAESGAAAHGAARGRAAAGGAADAPPRLIGGEQEKPKAVSGGANERH